MLLMSEIRRVLLISSILLACQCCPKAGEATVAANPPGAEPVKPAGQAKDPNPPARKKNLYIEQTYDYKALDDQAQKARKVTQKIFITSDKVAIHDKVESMIIDLAKKTVTSIDHRNKEYRTRTFKEIHESIQQNMKMQKANFEKLVGEQKNKMWGGLKGYLDHLTIYELKFEERIKDERDRHVDKATITAVRTFDGKTEKEETFKAVFSREVVLPFDNMEVLYYLELVTWEMVETFNKNNKRAKTMPLELTLVLPTGGTVQSKVKTFRYQETFEDHWFVPRSDYHDRNKTGGPVQLPDRPPEE